MANETAPGPTLLLSLHRDVLPTLMRCLAYLPLILIAAQITSYVRVWYRLREFKGPWLASFSELWMFKTAFTGQMHRVLFEVCEQYGDLARVGPNELITVDPEIARYMSAARHKHRKSDWYASLKVDPYVDNIFSERDLEKHDRLRASMASAFTVKENPELDRKIDTMIDSFIDLIERQYISTRSDLRPMDFGLVSQFFSLDIITSIAFGEAFGYLAQNKDLYDYIGIITQALPFVNLCSSTPTLGRFMDQGWLKRLAGPGPKDQNGLGKLMGLAQQVVGTRFGTEKVVRDDMLGSFLRHGMSQRQAESEILTQILAGSDTTSTAVRATFLFLITSPNVYSKLVAEIDFAIQAGAISAPITDLEAKERPYLQACIKEGLRIWPPFTGLLMKTVNKGGEVIKGRFVPEGTSIGHCGWGIQRNTVFGNDVDAFRPERWLEADPEQLKEMEKTVDLIFGSGRWGCLGKSIVYIELNKIFVELLRRFDFTILDPAHPWESSNHTLFLQNKMNVRITKRENPPVYKHLEQKGESN